MADPTDPLDPIVAKLREPVTLSPDLTDRVMAQIARDAVDAPPVRPAWWRRRWTLTITPLGGLAAAAALAGLLLLGRTLALPAPGDADPGPAAPVSALHAAATQFILVAPDARSVTVVGDFNDWNATATPLSRAAGDGVWWVTVPLEPGRYRYAFVVDGDVWRPDPQSPALEDEFGRPSSVMTIGGA